ncbi:reverse transcriptase-like protein [Zoogloea sp.]|mgnify:FL=1|jgi:ribonuclease HI|uniref:reverse transcriptase-like protein n=1 Tax=Zoogloea sp. TaxID=49181 RepID=UPI0035AFE239
MTTPAVAPPPPGPAEWQLWFDGSAQPNPGRLGLGAVLVGPGGERRDCSVLAPGHGCNNEAELLALAKALELARDAGARHLVLRGDSDFAVRHLRGEAVTQVGRLQALVAMIRGELGGFASVRLEWVPRHRNPDADRLSRAALGLPDKPAGRPSAKKKKRHR